MCSSRNRFNTFLTCDPHLYPSHQATNARLPHAKRPPPGGYVLTRYSGRTVSGNQPSAGEAN
jgi:hypothetical protein